MKKLWFPPSLPLQSLTLVSQGLPALLSLPHLPHYAQLVKKPPPAASPAAAGSKEHTFSWQYTIAEPGPCWGHIWVLPRPLPQIFMTSRVISDMSTLFETDQSSGFNTRKQASSPSAVAPLQNHPALAGPRRQMRTMGTCFFKYLLHSRREIEKKKKRTLWSLQCLFPYIAAAKKFSILVMLSFWKHRYCVLDLLEVWIYIVIVCSASKCTKTL